ncbi:phosphoglycerate mutase [Colletotrichum plurivorum]|uniref:Phosphoglycerate mutase n=1 Tax=Colletotrichum plurivorum TaxID=2175906 RepID=A0A8H6JI21_9PEZI|nr:phosphoglycerate mutase [Colletotrichum plurivorum]
MQSLLASSTGPRIVCTTRRLACDYSWSKFWDILSSDRVRFDPEKEIIYTRLAFNGQTIWEGSIQYDGQWRIALDTMLSRCSNLERRVEVLELEEQPDTSSEIGDATHDQQEEPESTGESQEHLAKISPSPDPGEAHDPGVDKASEDNEVVFVKTVPVKHPQDHGSVEDLFDSADDEASWRRTCEYFGHDETHVTKSPEHCRLLPGTKRALRPHQLDDVRRVIDQAVTQGHLGALLAHPMGVGKTITYQGVIAVRRLAFLSQEHFKADPEAHNNGSGLCARHGKPFGIQCACESEGLTAKFLKKFPRGATLIIAPSSITSQAVSDADGYFEPTLTILGKTFNFIRVVDWRDVVDGSRAKADAAQAICQLTVQSELPTKTRTTMNYKDWEVEGSNLLHTTGARVRLACGESDGTGLVLVVGQQRVSRDKQWRHRWTKQVTLPVRGGKQVTVTIGGTYFFGLMVWDEAHQVRGLDTSMAKILREILGRQTRPPMTVAATGCPITSGLTDMALVLSLLRNQMNDPRSLRQELKELDDKHTSFLNAAGQLAEGAASPDFIEFAKTACAKVFGCILRRPSSSTFRGHPIMDKKPVVTKNLECQVDNQFREPMDRLIATVGNTVVKKLQDARAVDSDGPAKVKENTTSRMDSDIHIITKSKDIRQLELATHMPGFLQAWENTQGAQAVETRWEDAVKLIGRGKGTVVPTKYYDKSIVPPGIWQNMDAILADCSRLRRLTSICKKAFDDGQTYPDDGESWAGFGGPKNIIIFSKWPILAYAIQLWFERAKDARFQSAFIHSGLPHDERQKIVDWFSEFSERQGGSGSDYGPKKHTKILVTTYALCGTGLDGLKVANYCVHFGVSKNVNDVDQATGRIDRQGQPLKSFVYHLESMAEPLDQLTALMRDSRSALFGEGGLLGEVVRLFNQQGQDV